MNTGGEDQFAVTDRVRASDEAYARGIEEVWDDYRRQASKAEDARNAFIGLKTRL